MTMPPEVAYGGVSFDGRDVLLQDTLTPAGQTASTYPGGWREGTTIPAEYYTEEKHYLNEERVVAEQFWLMADHESRITNPGGLFRVRVRPGGKPDHSARPGRDRERVPQCLPPSWLAVVPARDGWCHSLRSSP